jgi:hypothetical protein
MSVIATYRSDEGSSPTWRKQRQSWLSQPKRCRRTATGVSTPSNSVSGLLGLGARTVSSSSRWSNTSRACGDYARPAQGSPARRGGSALDLWAHCVSSSRSRRVAGACSRSLPSGRLVGSTCACRLIPGSGVAGGQALVVQIQITSGHPAVMDGATSRACFLRPAAARAAALSCGGISGHRSD